MIYVCQSCGAYRPDKRISRAGDVACCPECGHAHPFVRAPLFVLTGASGTGKSALCYALSRRACGAVPLETDQLWEPRYNTPEDGYRAFRETWLRLAMNIAQAGTPALLCGCATPEQFDACTARRYFGAVYYLALACEPDALARRLRARPAFRDSNEPFVAAQQAFDAALRALSRRDERMSLLDTTRLTPEQAADGVRAWIAEGLAHPEGAWTFEHGAAEACIAVMYETVAWLNASDKRMWGPPEIERTRQCPEEQFVLMRHQGVPAGTVMLSDFDPLFWPDAAPGEAVYVHKLCVRRAFAGQGSALRLLEYAARYCRARGIRKLRLDTDPHRPPLMALYKGAGFRQVGALRMNFPSMGELDVALFEMEVV